MRLEGKVALVTGASSGLGLAIARAFGREGARVVATGRRTDRLDEARKVLETEGVACRAVPGDVRSPDDCERWVREAVGAFGHLDILVNSAGIMRLGGLSDTRLEDWDDLFAVNVRGLFVMTRAAAAELGKRPGGSVIHLSSTAGGVRPFPTVAAYCATKAAVEMLTRCMALELAPAGVRVNAIAPGVVPTDLHRSAGMAEPAYAAFLERSKGLHPLGFLGEPQDVAAAAVFLASQESRWITGTTLVLDGGRTLVSPR